MEKKKRIDWISWLLLAVIVYLLAGQFMMSYQARKMEGQSLPALGPSLATVLMKHDKALLYFYSPTCPACRIMEPSIKSLAARHKNIYAIDITQDPAMAQKFRIMGTPTVVLATPKGIEKVRVGLQLKSSLEEMLQ